MSDDRPTTRQELYDRIRKSSKDEVILEEMIRLGFWPRDEPLAGASPEENRRWTELRQRMAALQTELSRLGDVESMKRAARRKRMDEALARREETRRRREEKRRARAAAWAARKDREVLYVGEGYSGTLGRTDGRVREGLPNLQDGAALARALGMSVGGLRWLAFAREVSPTSHYRRFSIPKKTGGTRLISAPMPKLKAAQRWILEEILLKVPVHEAAHGFVPGRSIVTNAAAHVGRGVVVNMDLRDFFPTLTFPRVRGLFRHLGYSPEAATLLALLTTEPETMEVELDGKRWHVALGERRLPQGSPASPAITNLICRKLDVRLTKLAAKLGGTYTRYADDLTFSGDALRVSTVLKAVPRVVADEGFTVHPDKTRVMTKGRRQEVTGLIVNERLGVPRRHLRRFRAVTEQVRRDGPKGKRFGLGDDVVASLFGFAAFVQMVDGAKGRALSAAVARAADAHGWTRPPRKVYPKRTPPPEPEPTTGPEPTRGEAPADGKRKWWQFWKKLD